MKISLCMIAKNEEKVIGRAIDSCKGVVDEIILVDTGSEDRTVEIAKAKGAKIYFYAWKNDFAAAKNYALSKAKGDWIVFLDADEYFGNDTGGNLRRILENIEPQYNAIVTYMINLDMQDGSQLDMMIQARIFKKSKNIRYVSPIHEYLYNFKQGEKVHGFFIEEDELILFHTGYSRQDQARKSQRNLELLQEEIKKENASPAYYAYMSDCYIGLAEWEKALEYARKFLETGTEMGAYKTRPYQNVIDAMRKLNYPKDQVIQEVKLAMEKFPNHPQFTFYMANVLFEDRKYDLSFAYLKKTLALHENYRELEINSLAVNLWYVYNALGANYELRGDKEKAIQYYKLSLQKDWNNDNCIDRLIRLLRTFPLEEAIDILDDTFDIRNEDCLNFLLGRLANTASPNMFAHYVIIRQKQFPKQDFVLLQMLLANRYYDKTVPALIDCVRVDDDVRLAIVTAVAIMLSEDESYKGFAELLPVALKNIVCGYFGESVDFSGISPRILVDIVNVFLLWGDSSQIERVLELRRYFTPELTVDLGILLAERRHFQTACDIYQALSNSFSAGGVLYYNFGYCLHQMGKAREAVECLIQAFDKGYRENDLYEVLRWNLDKISNEEELWKRGQGILKNKGEIVIK